MQAQEANSLAQEAELTMLRYQLNPHFLFNSLNSASALIGEDPEKAERMIEELSEFLRCTIGDSVTNQTTLANEIEMIKNYLNIEQVRFEEKLQVSFDVSEDVEELEVPGFLLHPLVENAVKYGMQTTKLPLAIEVAANIRNGLAVIRVTNTGNWVDESARNGSTGVGLGNVKKRLKQVYPNRHTFQVLKDDKKVSVVIEIKL